MRTVPRISRTRLKPVKPRSATARYLQNDRAGFLNIPRAVGRDIRLDVRESADRAYAMALHFSHNSGWIAGATDQLIADIVGTELKLNCLPDLSRLGYNEKERADWCRLVESEWRRWSWTPEECDLEGKATVPEMTDGIVRYYLASGEGFSAISYLTPAQRARYGVKTGVKASLIPPHRCPRQSLLFDGWDQGIRHDNNGRAIEYRFRQYRDGVDVDIDYPAYSGSLRTVIHVMDRGDTPNSPRGISVMAPVFKVISQADQLADATLTTALLQTAFAATIKSPEASQEAFDAIRMLDEMDDLEGSQDLSNDLMSVWEQRINSLKQNALSIGGDMSRVNHLGPGEEFEMHSSGTPGPQYKAFNEGLHREIARRLGVTFESYMLDWSSASYSSTKMSTASMWPITTRRRERIAAPFCQGVYEAFLDEAIAEGRIPFKGGYRAFAANRAKVVDAEWRGPEKPSADPYKDALANQIELQNGTTTLKQIWAAKGAAWDEEAMQQKAEKELLESNGLPHPFGRPVGGNGAGPLGAAAEGQRQPASAE